MLLQEFLRTCSVYPSYQGKSNRQVFEISKLLEILGKYLNGLGIFFHTIFRNVSIIFEIFRKFSEGIQNNPLEINYQDLR